MDQEIDEIGKQDANAFALTHSKQRVIARLAALPAQSRR
jgi:hypothetical protein